MYRVGNIDTFTKIQMFFFFFLNWVHLKFFHIIIPIVYYSRLIGVRFHRVFQTWQEKEAGKVVLYTTTMGIVRDTYQRCLQVRQILRTHLVKFVERDVFMSREVQKEIRERLGGDMISVPQLFVEGNLIGVGFFTFESYTE